MLLARLVHMCTARIVEERLQPTNQATTALKIISAYKTKNKEAHKI